MGWLDRLRRRPGKDAVIVVSGLPRSGTSMAMKMLEAGGLEVVQDGVRAADGDNPRGYYEDQRVKELAKSADKAWVAGARGKVLKVISYLLEDLPDEHRYQVLFVRRDLREVLASQARMLERRGETSDTSDERMIELFAGHFAQVGRMLAARANFAVLDLPHREVLADPLAQAKRMRDFLGRDLDVEAMAAVVDAKLYRNRAGAPGGSGGGG